MDRAARLVYVPAIVDCCTRELVAWTPDLRCRTEASIGCVEIAATERGVSRRR